MSGTLPSNESAAGDGSTEPDEFAVFFPLRDLLLFSAAEQTATLVFGTLFAKARALREQFEQKSARVQMLRCERLQVLLFTLFTSTPLPSLSCSVRLSAVRASGYSLL